MHTSLRIKQIYFDEIAAGEKRVEYRAATDRYRSMLIKDMPITSITLHYQRDARLTCKVLKICLIKTPRWILELGIITTKNCYAIHLTSPKRWTKA